MSPLLTTTHRSRTRLRRGFSFTEILFAVMILGIGFIMVAAIFPVAIQQTASSNEETAASTIAKGGVNVIEKYAVDSVMPTTVVGNIPNNVSGPALPPGQTAIPGVVMSFHDPRIMQTSRTNQAVQKLPPDQIDRMWAVVRQNLILPSDNRYAWVPMYKRDYVMNARTLGDTPVAYPMPAPYAQLIVIGVQVRNRSNYDGQLDIAHVGNAPATLEPKLTSASITHNTDGTSKIHITDSNGNARAGENAFVVVSDDRLPGTSRGLYNGRVYRIGNNTAPDGSGNTWQLAPGNDLAPGDPDLPNALVFIVGRGYVNPNSPNGGYEGLVQDIAVYTTFVQVLPDTQ